MRDVGFLFLISVVVYLLVATSKARGLKIAAGYHFGDQLFKFLEKLSYFFFSLIEGRVRLIGGWEKGSGIEDFFL